MALDQQRYWYIQSMTEGYRGRRTTASWECLGCSFSFVVLYIYVEALYNLRKCLCGNIEKGCEPYGEYTAH